jgi:hypothetical protein
MSQLNKSEAFAQTPRKREEGLSEALLFLALLGLNPENAYFRTIRKGRGGANGSRNGADLKGFDFEALSRDNHNGAGVFVLVNLTTGAIGVSGAVSDKDVAVCVVLFVEWDDKPLEWQEGAWRELGLPRPSLQVATGGKSIHNYWVLSDPTTPDQWRTAQQRLIAHCKSDPSLKNPSRFMRLPGFDYFDKETGKPTGKTRILNSECLQLVDGRPACPTYTLEQVLENVPELPAESKGFGTKQKTRTRRKTSRSLREIKAALECIPEILPGTGQRERFRALAWGLLHAVREAGGEDFDAEELLAEHSPEVGDVGDYFNTEPHSVTAATFWWMAREAGWEPASVLPERRPADLIAPAGEDVGVSCPIPPATEARLVALQSGMGTGKTNAIKAAVDAHLAEKSQVVVLTHRRSLGLMLADKFGLAWGNGSADGLSEEEQDRARRVGMVLCTDSLSPRSGVRFEASAFRGAVVVIDEVAQVLQHTLMTQSTSVAQRRVEVLKQLRALLKYAKQVLVGDAQLSEADLVTLENVMGCKALLIDSEHKAAAGRELVVHDKCSWRVELINHVKQHRRVWICTTSQKASSANSAQNLAQLVQRYWPEAGMLVVDSETMASPGHPAQRLGAETTELLAEVDVVIASPAVSAGLSVVMPGHFEAVFGFSGGSIEVAGFVQALARVRDDCPRHVYAAHASVGTALKVGSGSTDPAEILKHLSRHEEQCITQLLRLGWDVCPNTVGPWLELWGELAALQNRQRLNYREAVLGFLAREGYQRRDSALAAEDKAQAIEIGNQLKEITTERSLKEDQAVIETALISDDEAMVLKDAKRQLTPEEQNKLTRWRVARDWALGEAAPTPDLLEKDREGLHRRLRWGWLLLSTDGRSAAAEEDQAEGVRRWGRNYWAPDFCRKMEGPRLAAADLLRVPQWLERAQAGEWFTSDDPELRYLHKAMAEHSITAKQVLGVEPAQRATTELKALLSLAGYKLETKRRRCGKGKQAPADYFYRVVREDLPNGASLEAMEAKWLSDSRRRVHVEYKPLQFSGWGCTKNTPIKELEIALHPATSHPWAALGRDRALPNSTGNLDVTSAGPQPWPAR